MTKTRNIDILNINKEPVVQNAKQEKRDAWRFFGFCGKQVDTLGPHFVFTEQDLTTLQVPVGELSELEDKRLVVV